MERFSTDQTRDVERRLQDIDEKSNAAQMANDFNAGLAVSESDLLDRDRESASGAFDFAQKRGDMLTTDKQIAGQLSEGRIVLIQRSGWNYEKGLYENVRIVDAGGMFDEARLGSADGASPDTYVEGRVPTACTAQDPMGLGSQNLDINRFDQETLTLQKQSIPIEPHGASIGTPSSREPGRDRSSPPGAGDAGGGGKPYLMDRG